MLTKRSSCLSVLFACCLAWSGFDGVSLASGEQAAVAPLSAEFVEFTTPGGKAPARLLSASAEDDRPLGFIPGPVDYSYLKGQQIGAEAVAAFQPVRFFLPLQYDLRTTGKLTPMRDQGSCGDCWAFAAMGSVESALLPGENRDFSENNLKNRHGFDWGHCDGGNGDMSIAYLARRDGPVNESADPYNVSSNVSPAGLPTQKILTKAVIFPPRTDFLDNDAIKQAILDYGAVQSSYYSSSSPSYYRAATASYYYNGAEKANHAITLVGWDDNYDKSNFAIAPPGNGAFIVRNSWGAGWGQGGYFYLSYYDSKIGNYNYQFRGFEPVSKYAGIYQYDPLGNTSGVGYGTETAWFANIFTATANESIAAAGFHAASAGSTYDWYVYTGVTSGPRTGTLAAYGTDETLTAPGYHVVPLTPVAVTPGQKFSVVIRLTTPGYGYPVPVERPVANYASLATAAAGQSYFSINGSSWTDMAVYMANTNVNLKALSQYKVTAGITGGNGTITSANPAYTGTGGTATFDLTGNVGYRSSNTVTGSCPAGTFSGNSYTTGAINGNCTASFSFVPAPTQVLSIAIGGEGGGSVSVTPNPPGAICPGNCSQTFNEGTAVTLTPTPAAGSVFTGWSGACSGTGSCQLTMDEAKSVTATFAWQSYVKNSVTGNMYGLIGPLYGLLAGGEDLLLVATGFSENLIFGRPVSFSLKGGYDSSFLQATSFSTIYGSIVIVDGSVTMENIVIAP